MALNQIAVSQKADPQNINIADLPDSDVSSARVITITSGKGGVGKTNITANLGIALSRMNKKVCVIDADLGLANISILIGQRPEFTIEELLDGTRDLKEVMISGPEGLMIVPGATGIGKLSELDRGKREVWIETLKKLENDFDYILIDTSAGISSNVLSFVESAHESIIVISPEPTSLTDAYSLIKVLKGRGYHKSIYTLINMVLSYDDSVKIFSRFSATTQKFLDLELKYLGYVMMDQVMITSVIQQKPVTIFKPEATSSHCFNTIADKFESIYTTFSSESFSDHWEKLSAAIEPAEIDEVITPPVEVQQHYIDNNGKKESNKIKQDPVRMIETGELDEEKARDLIHSLDNAFVKKFEKQPFDPEDIILSSLAMSNFSGEKIKELSLVLESIYQKRYHRKLYDLRDVFLKLLEESTESEARMRKLYFIIENGFQKIFKKPIREVKEIITDLLMNENYPEEGFLETVSAIRELYRKRFDKKLKLALDFPSTEINTIISRMNENDVQLGEVASKIADLKEDRTQMKRQLTDMINDFFEK